MVGRYRAYPKYEDSALEWLGNMPSHWDLMKAKYLFMRVQREARETDGIVTAFRDGQVTLRSNRRTEGFTNAVKEIGYQGVRKGDLLVHAMDGFAGAIGVSDSDGKCSPVCSVCIPNEISQVYMPYYGYLVRQLAVTDFITSLAKGIRERSTEFRYSEFSCLELAVPTLDEQQTIANFLDHETAKIDTLIKKQQQLIKLLKEKRQAVISHAVTKGLNPNAPMRDSGAEWLGEVPEHWEVKRIKHFGKIVGGYAFKSGDFSVEGVKAIKIANVSHLEFDWADSSFLPYKKLAEQKEYILPRGSLVFAMTRPIVSGGVKVARFDSDEQCLVNQRVGFLKPNLNISQEYLMYVAQSKSFFCAFENNITATNQPNISSEGIEDIRFGCPSVKEQNEVVNYIKRFSDLIEETANKANEQINLMMERRTALISAAITGKIDVRGWRSNGAEH